VIAGVRFGRLGRSVVASRFGVFSVRRRAVLSDAPKHLFSLSLDAPLGTAREASPHSRRFAEFPHVPQ